jgi:hypothetical protein
MEKSIVSICTKKIEDKIGIHKPGGTLTNSDYEYILFLIEEKTKVRLSLSTIIRIWNNQYDRLPHISTLNALAQFLDFENWQSFKKTIVNNNHSNSKNSFHFGIKQKSLVIFGIVLASLAIIFSLMYALRFKQFNSKSDNVVFKSRTSIHKGLPNSVIFEYNVDDYKADSFFIQQTWEDFGKVQIYKNQHILTGIYYFPGQHVAKLIANTAIIKEIPIYIETDGWVGIISQENSKNFQIILKGIRHNGNLTINKDTLSYLGIDEYKLNTLQFCNVGNFGKSTGDNCEIDTRIKIENPSGSCPYFIFGMYDEKGQGVTIKFTTNGCISNAYAYINGMELNGRTNDLSNFGFDDVTKWQLLSITIKEKHVEIMLNGKSILKTIYSKPFGRIAGLIYTFNGIGSIDFVRIKSLDGKTIYQDEFNGK